MNRDVVEEGEIRRTWIACYYFASNVSILLRHPSLVRWTQYLEECLAFIGGPDGTDHDRWLCCMARTQQLAEEVSLIFNMDDPSSNVKFGDTSTQYHLKAFEKQIAAWRETVPSSVDPNLATQLSSSINLYMHEIAIHSDHNIDDFRPGPEDMSRPFYGPARSGYHAQPQTSGYHVSATHIDALAQCVDSSHRSLDAWLAMSVKRARCAPNLGIVWNTYAIVALIKLHGVLHAPDSRFGEIFSPDLKIDYYLHSVIERLQEIAADNLCPPAETFIYVVRKLRSWFEHKRSGFPEPSDGGDGVGRDGGFVVSHKEHANNIMELAQERHGLPPSGSLSHESTPKLDTATAPFQSAGGETVGTSSMPNSQLNPMGGPGLMGWTTNTQPGVGSQMSAAGGNGSQWPGMSDLNVAYNAANYNINWDELNFSQQELNVFDEVMGERGWMGFLI